jgi:hypothetical protein
LLETIADHLASITVNLQCSGVHDHSGEILGVAMNANQSAHVESSEILTDTTIDVYNGVCCGARTHRHPNPPLATCSVHNESSPTRAMSMIEKATQDSMRIGSLCSESTGIHHKNLIFVSGLGKLFRVGRGDPNQLLTVFHPI